MEFQGFTLDDFQVEAVNSIEAGNSVVVSAATGTGKTLVADWVIDKDIKAGKRVIYTAPIKALSNQKYRDFTKRYGKESIGIVTGDVQINTNAQVLIMTTEIYRNMLLARDELIGTVQHVIFDEIHYISDFERGTIWEESVIFSPKFVRFLCLSATIPNAQQFADWISSIKEHKVDVVQYSKRAVPLKHFVFDAELDLTTLTDLRKKIDKRTPRVGRNMRRERLRKPLPEQVVAELKRRDWLPCLYFVFSRMDCERQAGFLSKHFDFLDGMNKAKVQQRFREVIPKEQKTLESVRRARELCARGIGVHHAGLLPCVKEAVELLFADGLLKVLFTTETFAVGLNLPARATVFNSFTKFDGMNFRTLFAKEYWQLAGRAGRRGIDIEGFAIGVINRSTDDLERIAHITAADTEPIISQFRMSYNTALHLVIQHTPEEVEVILRSNFDQYVKKSEKGAARVTASYTNRLKKLQQMGYLDEDNKPTPRGHFLLNIYSYELLVGEIFSTEIWKDLSSEEIALVSAAIVYEERRQENYEQRGVREEVARILSVLDKNEYARREFNRKALKTLAVLVLRWCNDATFEDLLRVTDAAEGDIIHLLRRTIDLMRQVRHAAHDDNLRDKITKAMEMLDRDVVSVNL